MRVWALVLLASGTAAARSETVGYQSETNGYLFVSNRLDEALVARLGLPRIANATLVADEATVVELEARERASNGARRIFDVVVRSEDVLKGSSTRDSMGFRSQKPHGAPRLRALRATPYDVTAYLDSDTFACQDPWAIFAALGNADAGGIAQHSTVINGGVLVYRRAAFPLWRKWEALYDEVKAHTRREQPILQQALQWNEESGTVKFKNLPKQFNCRGVDVCGAAKNQAEECVIIHSHAAHAKAAARVVRSTPQLSRAAESAALKAAYAQACPRLSGGHPLVVITHAVTHVDTLTHVGTAAAAEERSAMQASLVDVLATRLRLLAKDNDASFCRAVSSKSVQKCFEARTRYASIVLHASNTADLDVRAQPVRFALLPQSNAVTIAEALHKCFADDGGAVCGAVAGVELKWLCAVSGVVECNLQTAMEGAKQFAGVLLEARPRNSLSLLAQMMPSHFMHVDDTHFVKVDEAPSSLSNAHLQTAVSTHLALLSGIDARNAEAYVEAQLSTDAALRDALAKRLETTLHACGARRRRP